MNEKRWAAAALAALVCAGAFQAWQLTPQTGSTLEIATGEQEGASARCLPRRRC